MKTTLDLAGWLWDRLRAANGAVSLGQLIWESREAGLLTSPTSEEPKPKLTVLYDARRRVAVAHPGWHVKQSEAPGTGDKPVKLWTLATGSDPDPEIDFDQVIGMLDLPAMVKAATDRERGGRYGCPWHVSDSNSTTLAILSDGKHWKCYRCGADGDALDWKAREDGCTRVEAARRVLGLPALPVARNTASQPHQATRQAAPEAQVDRSDLDATEKPQKPITAVWQDPLWQAAVDRIVTQAVDTLWSRAGRPALDWLRARSLDDQTIRRFRLGFVPDRMNTENIPALGLDDRGESRRIWVSRGITLPWVRPGTWYDPTDGDCEPRWVGCNVRLLPFGDVFGPLPADVDKYRTLAGSERGHAYPWPELTALGDPALVCEGEFDSLIGWQEAGWVANVVSFGGAGQAKLHDDARAFLAACPDWLLLFDQDDAGDGAARAMARRAPHRCRRLRLPDGVNDLNDLHRNGVRILDWLWVEWERFGWKSTIGTQSLEVVKP
jgi:Toprim-like